MRLQFLLIFEVDLGGKNKEKILGFELATFGITVQILNHLSRHHHCQVIFLVRLTIKRRIKPGIFIFEKSFSSSKLKPSGKIEFFDRSLTLNRNRPFLG